MRRSPCAEGRRRRRLDREQPPRPPAMSDHGCIHLNNFKAAKGIQPYKVIHSFFVTSTSNEARLRKVTHTPSISVSLSPSLSSLSFNPIPAVPDLRALAPPPLASERADECQVVDGGGAAPDFWQVADRVADSRNKHSVRARISRDALLLGSLPFFTLSFFTL